MERKSIVSDICDHADEFLAGVTKRAEAKAGIDEWLTIHHLQLLPDQRAGIIRQAMDVLEREEFFAIEAGSDE